MNEPELMRIIRPERIKIATRPADKAERESRLPELERRAAERRPLWLDCNRVPQLGGLRCE